MKVGIVGTEQDPSEHTGEIIKVDRVNPTRHCNIVNPSRNSNSRQINTQLKTVTVDRVSPSRKSKSRQSKPKWAQDEEVNERLAGCTPVNPKLHHYHHCHRTYAGIIIMIFKLDSVE